MILIKEKTIITILASSFTWWKGMPATDRDQKRGIVGNSDDVEVLGDIQMGVSSRQLNFWVWSSGERYGLQIQADFKVFNIQIVNWSHGVDIPQRECIKKEEVRFFERTVPSITSTRDGGKRICKEVQQGAGDVGGEPGKRGAGEAFREEERLIALNAAEG